MSVESATLRVPKLALYRIIIIAVLAATLIVVCFVLPAEFRIDPTGVGKATGVIRLSGPKKMTVSDALAAAGVPTSAADNAQVANPAVPGTTLAGTTARYYNGGYRSDFVDIPLAVSGSASRGEELEYKVHMKAGDTLAYSWSVVGIEKPDEFYYDFHGEQPATAPNTEATVVEYRQATGTQSQGTLVAPFDGVFGWYLQNQSEKPVLVHLKISGFYTLVPPGEYGNDAGIEANKAK